MSSRRPALQPELANRLLEGERSAVAEALNLADDQRPQARANAIAMLSTLEREMAFPGPTRVGLTGAPGAGKSTLLDAIVRSLRARGETVAIAAVDPSSRGTGGALLGDRIRVRSAAADPGVFVRSMAARNRLGGLSDAARAGVIILAAVFDHVFVETVGVGQSESEVVGLVDTLVFVANPGSGDELQYMKSGLIELPDIFAVNKSDLGAAARRTASELETARALAPPTQDGWIPPVIPISARDSVGIDRLLDSIAEHRTHSERCGSLAARREAGAREFVIDALRTRFGTFGLERMGGEDFVLQRMQEAPKSAFLWVDTLSREIEDALWKPA